MPADKELHKRLKIHATLSEMTIAEVSDLFIQFGLDFKVLEMTDQQVRDLRLMIEKTKASSLGELVEKLKCQ